MVLFGLLWMDSFVKVQKLYIKFLDVISMCTESEQLFKKYCALRGYGIKPIEIIPGDGQFPDYEIQTPCGSVICEVKEILPNEEDKATDETLKRYGRLPIANERKIGKRPRSALKKACKQLGRFRYDSRPCVAVLYDKTFAYYLEPEEIDAAMFGDLVVLFPKNPTDWGLDFTHGSDQSLDLKRGRYLGAVAVLRSADHEGPFRLDIYHNPFTSKPVSRAYFPDPQDRHFFKEEGLAGWEL